MIKRLTGGWNIIEYSGKKPKMALIRHDYQTPICKVHITMRDCFGNKIEDTTTLGKNWNEYHRNTTSQKLVRDFLYDLAFLRDMMSIPLDSKTYVNGNVKVISVEIIDEWTEDAYWLEEVVSPKQD